MTRWKKLVERLKARPTDFSWDQLVRLLEGLGYRQVAVGRTGGSRRRFVHPTAPLISLHQPHPGRIVKRYVIDAVLQLLTEADLL